MITRITNTSRTHPLDALRLPACPVHRPGCSWPILKTSTVEVCIPALEHIFSADSFITLHESVLKRIHVAAGVTQPLHDSLGSRGNFQNASFLAFVSPSFCLQSLSFVILRRLPFARRPISPPSLFSFPIPFQFLPSFVISACSVTPFLFWSFSIVDFS